MTTEPQELDPDRNPEVYGCCSACKEALYWDPHCRAPVCINSTCKERYKPQALIADPQEPEAECYAGCEDPNCPYTHPRSKSHDRQA